MLTVTEPKLTLVPLHGLADSTDRSYCDLLLWYKLVLYYYYCYLCTSDGDVQLVRPY